MRDTHFTYPAASDGKAASAIAGLTYINANEPGIRRIKHTKGFAYLHPNGKRVRSRTTLQRIARLAIPPAYTDVWISSDPRAHLQATGRDARGRKQYRYHEHWRETRDSAKFDRMIAFGAALPRLRRRLRTDLAKLGLPREKVLAVIVSLLDRTRARIGNDEYARSNKSYGLTTLHNRHVRFRSDHVLLKFNGKSGVKHEIEIDDPRLARIMHRCQELPGQRLFQYVDNDGNCHAVDSTQVNDYLRIVMGGEFTAKDFRTWNGTLQALSLMAKTPLPERRTERACKACIKEAIAQVAAELRNTPAVCRKSYINPVVFQCWQDGLLHRRLGKSLGKKKISEQSLLGFLRNRARAERPAPNVSDASTRTNRFFAGC